MSIAWVSITLPLVQNLLNSNQLAAINTSNLAPGQSDRITATIPMVVAQMRDDIENNGQNVLDADTTTVPPGLQLTGAWLVVRALSMALSITLPLTDDQKEMIKESVERMKEVYEGKRRVATPLTSAPTSQQISYPVMVKQNQILTARCEVNGL